MLKNELNNIKYEEKILNYRRLLKQQEYENLLNLEKLNEKSKRMEEYRDQKSLLATKKRQLQEEIHKQKKDVMEKFDKILSSNKGLTVRLYHLKTA